MEYAIVVLLVLLAAALLLVTAYLGALTLLALIAPRTAPTPDGVWRRFAILIPAHNEELLLGRTLASLTALRYPTTHYTVHVVADNCTDRTALVAETDGARVHVREDAEELGKGHALRWLLARLQAAGEPFDAAVVLDADTVVDANFLAALNARLAGGSQVVQAYYSVLNVGESPLAGLRLAALAAVHYLRPLGRSLLGLSCGLKGNGMCFAAPVLERFPWQWYTLAEDVEFHLALVRAGVRVDFAWETRVRAEMPTSLAQAASQNRRWERGRLQLVRRHAWPLLLDGLRRRDLLRIDAAVEQFVPPLSVPFALGMICLVASLALGAVVPAVLAGGSLAVQGAYLLVAMRLAGCPPAAYLALAYAPVYVAWKLALYCWALLRPGASHWVRTARLAR